MIINKPTNIHQIKPDGSSPVLPEQKGWLKHEEIFDVPRADKVLKVRSVTFVPGVKILGILLLIAGGILAVKPADGMQPAQLQPGAVSMAIIGLAILLWKREIRHDAIVQNNPIMES